MNLFLVILFACLISLSTQQTTFCTNCVAPFKVTFQSAGSTTQFRPRNVIATFFPLPVVGGLIESRSATLVSGEKTVDLVRATAFAIPNILAPTCVLGFWNRSTDAQNGTNGYDYSVTGIGNFISTRYNSLEEVDVNGNVVNRITLKTLNWAQRNSSGGAGTGVPYFSMFASSTGSYGTVNFEFSFIAFAKAATVTLALSGGVSGPPPALVAPKSIETIVVIDSTNYNYNNSANSLRLNTYTATGNVQRNVNISSSNALIKGQVFSSITSQNGTDPRFAAGIRFAQLGYSAKNGNTPAIFNVSSSSDTTIFTNADPVGVQISTLFGAQGTLTWVPIVVKPAGYQGIYYYDPTSTSGTDPATQSSLNSSSTTLAFSLIAFVLAMLLFF